MRTGVEENIGIKLSATRAFVIGPIGEKDGEPGTAGRIAYEDGIQAFEEVIEPACRAYGLEVLRADMIAEQGEIPEQIFRCLRDCAVVIADLTGANPNVMYELGLRHTTGKLTLQIGERGRLPFDVSAIRTIMFKRSAAGLVQARKDLAKALAASLDSGGDPVTATRVWFESPAVPSGASAQDISSDDTGLVEDDSPGFLELLAEMEGGIQSLTQTMGAATNIIEEITSIYNGAVANVREANARGDGAGARLAIADHTAKQLEEQAARLEIVAGEYSQTVDRIDPGMRYMLGRLIDEPDQLIELPDLPDQVRSLCVAADSSVPVTLSMAENALESGKASRSLRRACNRLAPAFKRFSETSTRVSSWLGLVDQLASPNQ
jgi:hypothetical protein